MSAIVATMTGVCLGLSILYLGLLASTWRHRRAVQTYRFHAIRDDLDMLLVTGELKADDELARFLRFVLNLGIASAGDMGLRRAVQVAQTIDERLPDAPGVTGKDLLADAASRGEAVQHVVAGTFLALADMLLANDLLALAAIRVQAMVARVRAMFKPWKPEELRARRYRVPRHASSEVAQRARRFEHLADQVCLHT